MDSARRWTDKQLKHMEKRLRTMYVKSYNGIADKWISYMKRSNLAISGLQDEYDKVLLTGDRKAISEAKERLIKAKENQTFRNQYYRDMVNTTAHNITSVNQRAVAYMNGEMPSIFVKNYNYIGDEAESLGIAFNLVDEHTVRKMILDNDVKLPKKKVEVPKDVAWNTKKMNSAVLQGILQGESMDKIAKRLVPIVGENKDSAIRNARTMVTGAENAGRQASYQELSKKGVVMTKEWIATGDSRTRAWHLDMDGQEVGIDDMFVDGEGNELEYPGDPNAEPETVYNCRCTMQSHIKSFIDKDGNVHEVGHKQDETMHDKEIAREKKIRTEKKQEKIAKAQTPKKENVSKIREKNIESIEEQDRFLNYEKGAIIADDGTIIARYDGTTHAVEIDENDLKLLENATFTHNHPNGGFFSNNDIITGFIKGDLKELRASTPQGIVYVLANNNVTKESAKKYLAEFQQTSMKAQRTAQEYYVRKIKAGELSMDEYQKNYFKLYSQYKDEKLIKMTQEKASDYGFVFKVVQK